MSEYREPIRIPADDPICSATAMNGTIVGILFQKKGFEIKGAISQRIQKIEGKIAEYEGVIKDADKFLKTKKTQIEELDKIYSDRSDEKKALTRPYERKIDDVRKEMGDKVHDFNRDTEKRIAEKSLNFEKGFDSLEDHFKNIDALMEEEKDYKNILRFHTDSGTTSGIYNSSTFTCSDNAGIGTDNPMMLFNVTEAEDRALAKLNTLKSKVQSYLSKVDSIQSKIEQLEEEKRRLSLMQRHIESDMTFKLDLNKLSAFGFEDVIVE